MIRVKLAELKPDMTIASDVTTDEGRLLLPSGTVLSGRSIRLLKAWGVIEAEIEYEGSLPRDEGEERLNPEVLATVRRINERRFMHVDREHPAMIELEDIFTTKIAHSMEQGFCPAEHSWEEDEPPVGLADLGSIAPINLAQLSQVGLRLPTLPSVFNRINEIIMNPNSSAGDIAHVVSKDSGLTSQLLGIVNSAFYGFVSKIDTVSRAVAIVGTKQLTSLVFGISVIKVFEKIPARHMDMKQFWRHSVACGIAARIIAGYKNIQNTERLFVAGLLHDIGRLIMFRLWPEQSLQALLMTRRDSRLFYRVEKEFLGIDHAGIGALMAERWKLPFLLESTIRYHHSPAASHNLLEASIVHLADVIVHAMDMGSSGDPFVPPLDETAWDALAVSENMLTVIIDQVERQIDEVTAYFFTDSKQES